MKARKGERIWREDMERERDDGDMELRDIK